MVDFSEKWNSSRTPLDQLFIYFVRYHTHWNLPSTSSSASFFLSCKVFYDLYYENYKRFHTYFHSNLVENQSNQDGWFMDDYKKEHWNRLHTSVIFGIRKLLSEYHRNPWPGISYSPSQTSRRKCHRVHKKLNKRWWTTNFPFDHVV